MDKLGLSQLLDSGVTALSKALSSFRAQHMEGAAADDSIGTVLDRLTQIGTALVETRARELYPMYVEAWERAFAEARPATPGLGQVRNSEAQLLLEFGCRLFTVGGVARRREQFDFMRELTLIQPNKDYQFYYWSRYVVTMVARGDRKWGKSLIPPASDYVRARGPFFALFQEDIDIAVNAMCQYDLFQCTLILLNTGDPARMYPNFGTFWNDRTTPFVREMIENASVRDALGAPSDSALRQVLKTLDEYAAEAFFGISGWTRNDWGHPTVSTFIRAPD